MNEGIKIESIHPIIELKGSEIILTRRPLIPLIMAVATLFCLAVLIFSLREDPWMMNGAFGNTISLGFTFTFFTIIAFGGFGLFLWGEKLVINRDAGTYQHQRGWGPFSHTEFGSLIEIKIILVGILRSSPNDFRSAEIFLAIKNLNPFSVCVAYNTEEKDRVINEWKSVLPFSDVEEV